MAPLPHLSRFAPSGLTAVDEHAAGGECALVPTSMLADRR
jgi:hypothetical protein